LKNWKSGRKRLIFADTVYTLTWTFPDEERFGLTNQMRRAAVSISSNLAEGSSRSSRPDFARFVEIATGFNVRGGFAGNHFKSDKAFCRKLISINYIPPARNKVKCLSGLRRSLLESPA